jgi:hypothetical protein
MRSSLISRSNGSSRKQRIRRAMEFAAVLLRKSLRSGGRRAPGSLELDNQDAYGSVETV